MKNFKKFSLLPVLLSATALVLSGCAHDEKHVAKPASPAPTATKPAEVATTPTALTATKSAIDQAALNRLKQMSDTLTSAKSFTYHSKSFLELQAPETGQLLTFVNHAELALQRPNKLRVDVEGDVRTLQLYFDGEKASAIDVDKNVYAVSPPLTTIDDMIAYVLSKARIGLPAADFLNSNPYAVMSKEVTYAAHVSESVVNGVVCDHYAYMEPNVDWEIWIQKGDNALPLRLAMTYKQAKDSPHFLIEFFDWQLNPKLTAKTFVFNKPKDAVQAEFGYYQAEATKK